jgi:hypothetical protein
MRLYLAGNGAVLQQFEIVQRMNRLHVDGHLDWVEE